MKESFRKLKFKFQALFVGGSLDGQFLGVDDNTITVSHREERYRRYDISISKDESVVIFGPEDDQPMEIMMKLVENYVDVVRVYPLECDFLVGKHPHITTIASDVEKGSRVLFNRGREAPQTGTMGDLSKEEKDGRD